MGIVKMWCATRFNSWPFLLPIYINDVSTIVNKDNNMVLFADDTSIIITDTNRRDFNVNANQTFQQINTWFKVNLLTLYLNKTLNLELRIIVMLIHKLNMIRNV
jgi:hypothetical protein